MSHFRIKANPWLMVFPLIVAVSSLDGVLAVARADTLTDQAAVHEEDVASGRLIIKLKQAVALSSQPSLRRMEYDAEQIHALLADNRVRASWLRAGSGGSQVLQWLPGVTPAQRVVDINRLRSDPRIEYVIADRVLRINSVTPNDPGFPSQWHLGGSPATTGTANVSNAWRQFRGSSQVVIAVIDSGVVMNHPDLAGRLLNGYDFVSEVPNANDGDGRDADPSDPGNWVSTSDANSSTFSGCNVRNSSWHGTFIAGLIAANTNNGASVAGVDWHARILPVRALGKCGGLLSDVMDGVRWAAGLDVPGVPRNSQPAQIINLSLGGGTTCSTLEQNTIQEVTQAGALVVAAAGNLGGAVEAPARCNGALAVGALDLDGSRAAYSALGSPLALMAPGGFSDSLLSLGNTGTTSPAAHTTTLKVGTSFAAPIAAAVAGLLKGAAPTATPAQLTQWLKDSARPFRTLSNLPSCSLSSGIRTCQCTTAVCGAGALDADNALALARSTSPLANALYTLASASGNGQQTLTLDGSGSTAFSGRSIASYRWELLDTNNVATLTGSQAVVTTSFSTAAGNQRYRLTVQDSVGVSHSATVIVGDANQAERSLSTVTQASSAGSSSGGATSTSVSSSGGGAGGGGGRWSPFALLWLVLAMAVVRGQGGIYPFHLKTPGNLFDYFKKAFSAGS